MSSIDWNNNEHCLEAVKEYFWALQFVKEQTPEICLEAIKHFDMAINQVKPEIKQTEKFKRGILKLKIESS